MTNWPNADVKVRSVIAVAARLWRILKSCCWNAPIDHGTTTRVSQPMSDRHEQRGDDEGPEQAKRAHPGRLERRHLEIPGEAAAHEQHGDEQGHGQREAQERGQHEDEERQDELERARSW